MFNEYDDLRLILAEARHRVADSRYIWCVAADGFETTVSQRQGLILGGAWSPHFLRDSGTFWWDIPWTVQLRNPTIVSVDRAVSPIPEWVPLLEAIAQAGESLLLVTREVSADLLRMLIVNALKETLACCVVRDTEDFPAWGRPAANSPWGIAETPPRTAAQLPKGAEAWIRRNATLLFPSTDGDWRTAVQEVTVISVGGKNHDDQHDRLRFLVEAIQD